ncbi:MAG: beta-aspartyl-peptidase [Clostridioides sp.]|jgi:beta-aspartyl-dipeptidase (metallo-type)|nr:beta-aspartyl-peptidase [Clostridioides sp.]
MLVIKNVDVYSPEHLGVRDILICNEKIEFISENIPDIPVDCEILDGTDLILTPGFIDNHVHIAGGGGEGSFHTRTPEIQLSELIKAGITTVVGLLGTDTMTRSIENLYAKTRALSEEGMTSYMLTGGYSHPGPTITGSADKDITFIREVLGLKLAISDHRAPNISLDEFKKIASATRVAGMLSDKPGIVVLHMGDATTGLDMVFDSVEETAIPIRIFRPTHVNRNPDLLEQSYEFLARGGYIDLTCGISDSREPGYCIVEAMNRNLPLDHITISSDGHGSWSNYADDGTLLEIGVSGVDTLLKEVHRLVIELNIPLENAITYLTSNVAKSLNIYPNKGSIQVGSDADILIMSKNLDLDTVIAKGRVMMHGGNLRQKGTYEQ